MTTASEAMDAAQDARREVAGLDGRLGALECQVRDHRQESQDAHRETQRMVGDLAKSVAHMQGAASLTPAPPPGPSLTLTPARVVGVAKWMAGVFAALGIGGGVLAQCTP